MWYLYPLTVITSPNNGDGDINVLDTFDSLEAGLEYLSTLEGKTEADWQNMVIKRGNYVLSDEMFV